MSPVIDVEGIYNFRSITTHSSNLALRPDFIFRSAQPYSATSTGLETINALGITTIFDLRSDKELDETSKVTPLRAMEGLQRVSVPIFTSPEEKVTSKLLAFNSNDMQPILAAYRKMIAEGPKCFRQIFLHLRDKPDEPCIIHCALGKDRTGVVVALILSLAGVPREEITEEYLLTNRELEHYKPKVRIFLASMSKSEWDEEKVDAMLNVRAETMFALLDVLDSEYGGVEAYLRNQCLFSGEDIERIRENMRTKPAKADPASH